MASKNRINTDLTIEYASDDPAVDVTRAYLGNIRFNEDKVLRSLGGNLEVYEDVYRDDRVKSCLQQRLGAITSRDWDVTPGGDAALDKQAAEQTKRMLSSIGIDRLTEKLLLQSLLKGCGVGEVIWSIRDSMIWPAAVRVKRSQRFTFAPFYTLQPKSNRYEDVVAAMRLESFLRMRTWSEPVDGIALPARKFIVHSVGALDDDNPFGTGLGFWLYWPVRFKREGMALWLQFIDKFGSPSTKGTYPATASEAEKNRLLAALRALRSNSVTAIPEGMSAELIEAAKSGISTHEQLIDRMDQAITTAILSQTLTTSQGDRGSQALGTVHELVKDQVAKSDADALSETLAATLIRWFCEFNFPAAAVPEIWRDMSEVEDLGARADRDEKLARASGRNLDAQYVEEEYGIKLTDASPPPDGGITQVAAAASFAESASAPDAVERIAGQLEHEAMPITDAMINQARALLDECADLSEFADRLPELLGTMDTSAITRLMAKAFATANLAGQFEVPHEK